jgi:hypothetical protein
LSSGKQDIVAILDFNGYHRLMSEKVTGYLLLVIGLIIMFFSFINMIMVFTNKAEPVSLFNISSDSSSGSLNINDIISQLQQNNQEVTNQTIPQPKIDILPPEVLSKTLNISSHFFFITFVLGFGYKLSSLGIQLIRPINVKLKSPTAPPQV